MNKFFILGLAFLLAACGNGASDEGAKDLGKSELQDAGVDLEDDKSNEDDGENLAKNDKEVKDLSDEKLVDENKDYEDIGDDEKAEIYSDLAGKMIDTSFYPSSTFTQINFEEDGKFTGFYSSAYNFDGVDYGHQAIAVEKYYTDELHKSEFVGQFEILGKITEGVYRIKLKDFKLTTETGFDPEFEHTYYVDFAEALDENDTYDLYLPGTKLSDEILADTEKAQFFTPILTNNPSPYINHHYGNSEVDEIPDHTIGFVIYNKTVDKTFTDYQLN